MRSRTGRDSLAQRRLNKNILTAFPCFPLRENGCFRRTEIPGIIIGALFGVNTAVLAEITE
jgi:hypothetical protein